MDIHKIMELDRMCPERPMQEVGAMQYLQRFIASLNSTSILNIINVGHYVS